MADQGVVQECWSFADYLSDNLYTWRTKLKGGVQVEDLLRTLFYDSFQSFLRDEKENILNGTSERHLCQRLSIPLQSKADEAGLLGYFADTEYNRNFDGRVKTILDERSVVVKITCDLILHSRGVIKKHDNLIAVEMKRRERPESEKDDDRARLRALTKASYDDVWSADGETLPEHVCGYDLGYYLELDLKNRCFLLEEYRAGHLHDSSVLKF